MNGLRFLGMEYFGSRDEDTARTSLVEAERGDLFVCIIGGRYGSGITESEYERACETGKPCFIYFKRAHAIQQWDDDPAAAMRLREFSAKLRRTHTCSEFDTPEELVLKLSVDLHNWLVARHLTRGLSRLSVEYLVRVQAFVSEYTGTPERPTPFGGRDAEFATLDAWLDDPSAPPYLLIAAGAGRGKSALLVRWTQWLLGQGRGVVPLFFPISIRFRTNLANVFFASLTSYLASLHDEQLSVSPDTPPEVWRARLTELLARPLSGKRRLLLVLDGLDEAADWEAGPDLFPTDLGRHARVVVSARLLGGDTDATGWLRRLGWIGLRGAQTLSLSGLSDQGVADVLEHMGAPLSQLGIRADIVRELHRLSDGDPLLVRLYVDDLLKQAPLSARLKVTDLHTIAPGLDGYYERWWDDQRRLWGEGRPLREKRVQLLLELLAGALGPLSRDDLLGLAPAELDSWSLVDAMEPLDRFIVGDGIHNGFVFSHPRLGIFWRERLPRSERDRLEERFLRWCEGEVALAERDSTYVLPSYVVEYFGAHLDRHKAPAIRFRPMLTESWRRAWVALEGANSGYRTDLRRIEEAVGNCVRTNSRAETDLVEIGARCALCIASVDEVSRTMPVELIAPLVTKRIWGGKGALRFARSIGDPMRRARALAELIGGESPEVRAVVMLEIIDILRGCVANEALFDVDVSERVVSLLGDLSADLSHEAIDPALDLALGLQKRSLMVEAVRHLLPRLGPGQVRRVLKTALAMRDEELRLRLLGEVARRNAGAVAEFAASNATGAWERAWVLLACAGQEGEGRASALEDALAACVSVLPSLPVRLEAAQSELLLAWAERSERGLALEHATRLFDSLIHAPVGDQRLRQLTSLVAASRDDKLRLDTVVHALETLVLLREPSAWITGGTLLRCALCTVDSSDPRLVNALDSAFACATGLSGESAFPREWEPRLAHIAKHLPVLQGNLMRALVRRVTDPVELVEVLVPWRASLDSSDLAWLVTDVCLTADAGPEWKHRSVSELAPHLSTADIQTLLDRLDQFEPDTMLAVVAALPVGLPETLSVRAAQIVLRARCEGDPRHAELWAAKTDAEGAATVSRELASRRHRSSSERRLLTALAPRLERDDLERCACSLQAIEDDPAHLLESCLKTLSSHHATRGLTSAWQALGADSRASLLAHWWARGDDPSPEFYEQVVAGVLQASSETSLASAVLHVVEHGGTSVADDLARRVVSSSEGPLMASSRSARIAAMLAPRVSDGVLLQHFNWFLGGLLGDAGGESQALFGCVSRVPADCFIRAFEVACQRIVERKEDPDDEAPTGALRSLAQLASRLDGSEMPLAKPLFAAIAASPEHNQVEASLEFGLRHDGPARLTEEMRTLMLGLKRPMSILSAALGWSARASEQPVCSLVLELVGRLPAAGEAARRLAASADLPLSVRTAAASGAWGCVLLLHSADWHRQEPAPRFRQLAEREVMLFSMVDHHGTEPPPLLPALIYLLPAASDRIQRNVLAGALRVVRTAWRYPWASGVVNAYAKEVLGPCLRHLTARQINRLWQRVRQLSSWIPLHGHTFDLFVEHLDSDVVRSQSDEITKHLVDLGPRSLVRWASVMCSNDTGDLVLQIGALHDASARAVAATAIAVNRPLSEAAQWKALALSSLYEIDGWQFGEQIAEKMTRLLGKNAWPELQANSAIPLVELPPGEPEDLEVARPASKGPDIVSWFWAARVSRSELMSCLAHEIEDGRVCDRSAIEAVVVATLDVRTWWP